MVCMRCKEEEKKIKNYSYKTIEHKIPYTLGRAHTLHTQTHTLHTHKVKRKIIFSYQAIFFLSFTFRCLFFLYCRYINFIYFIFLWNGKHVLWHIYIHNVLICFRYVYITFILKQKALSYLSLRTVSQFSKIFGAGKKKHNNKKSIPHVLYNTLMNFSRLP